MSGCVIDTERAARKRAEEIPVPEGWVAREISAVPTQGFRPGSYYGVAYYAYANDSRPLDILNRTATLWREAGIETPNSPDGPYSCGRHKQEDCWYLDGLAGDRTYSCAVQWPLSHDRELPFDPPIDTAHLVLHCHV